MSESEDTYEPEFDAEYWPGEWVSRDAIEPNNWNPNRLDDDEFERLVKSIKDNGWTMPIVVHAEERYIIDGEHRWLAAKHLPDDPDLTPEDTPSDHVPVYGITVEEEQAKLATVQHNRARGEVHVDPLHDYLESLNDRGVLDSVHDRIGFSSEETEEILGDIGTPDTPDEPMPWEEEVEADVEETDADEESDADADESEDTREPSIPDLHQDRTVALRGDVDEETLADAHSVTEALTEAEFERVCKALGDEMRAQSLVNLATYADAHDAVEDITGE